MTGRAGVPQAEASDAVGVDVLRGALELGEDGEVVAGVPGIRMRDLKQDRSVTLDNERAV